MATSISPKTQNSAESIQWLTEQSAIADAQCQTALKAINSFFAQVMENKTPIDIAKLDALIAENELILARGHELNKNWNDHVAANKSKSPASSPSRPPRHPVEKPSPIHRTLPIKITSAPSRLSRIKAEVDPMPFLCLPNTHFSATSTSLAGKSLTTLKLSPEHG